LDSSSFEINDKTESIPKINKVIVNVNSKDLINKISIIVNGEEV
jgi:hypothetical protein